MTTRVGFLGGGLIANYHGKMLHTSEADVEIVAVHDPDPAKSAAFAAASGARQVDNEHDVFDAVDAVYVCTWTAEHPRLVAEAAARGLAVFCEKPLAVDLAGALDMVEAVRGAGVVNQVGLVLRDSPAFLLLRELVQRPQSGRVMSVMFRDDQYIPVQGMYASTWRGDPARAGSGALLEHSIHDLDLLEWLLGPAVTVSGYSGEFHGLPGIEDVVTASIAFESGALVTLNSVWHDVLSRPSQRLVEVFCERAYYVVEGDVFGPVRWMGPGEDEGVAVDDGLLGRLHDSGVRVRNPDQGFIEAVQRGGPASPTFEDALRAHLLTDAIYRSCAEQGRPIQVPTGLPGVDGR